MKIFESNNNVYDAVDAFIEHGIVAIEGTKTPAVNYINRLKECLKAYEEADPTESYESVSNHGYLYFVYDLNRFTPMSKELSKTIRYIDSIHPV